MMRPVLTIMLFLAWASPSLLAQDPPPRGSIKQRYVKQESQIAMRDGVKLFTSIYAPKDTSKKYPFLLMRTPYSVAPYGPDAYAFLLGPSKHFEDAGYIFVMQDVRGCFMSEGTFDDMRPHRQKKSGPQDTDESTDTYDTIDWLVKNVPNNNGRAGQWGISYPGFYSAAGMIDHHPALRAVSPQAPIADWWYDDFHHHGAFFLPHAFNFLATFGQSRPKPTTLWPKQFDHGTKDGYQFFLNMGSLKNANSRYFRDRVGMWNLMVEHPNYDSYWQARNLLPHLKNVAPAVLTVGGWFDAEDLYGPLQIYRSIEAKNPGIFNALVMGPWSHGGWHRGSGERLGGVSFGSKTAPEFQKDIEFPFFEHNLKDMGQPKLAEAMVFETGANRWRQFDAWPPKKTKQQKLYFGAKGSLKFDSLPAEVDGAFDEFVSDPNKPVPFTEGSHIGMTTEYMTDDQRFAARRPDVMVYQTAPLTEDVTLAGPLTADLRVSTTGTDSDWIVKLIDVFPHKEPGQEGAAGLDGYQMMVRSEVMRGRFRESKEKPEPFIPNKVTKVPVELQDVFHTFQKGHRIMFQVQSTWFPLVDRNPQKFVPNIYLAEESDFIKATHRVYRSKNEPTSVTVGVLAVSSQ